MYSPSEFGLMLKAERIHVGLNQSELAEAIGKTGQYISNIEKGKNNSPPKEEDIEALIKKLDLKPEKAKEFRKKAAADRNRLPSSQMQYILSHPSLLKLICIAEERCADDTLWQDILTNCTQLNLE